MWLLSSPITTGSKQTNFWEDLDSGKKSHPTVVQLTEELEPTMQQNYLVSCNLWRGCFSLWVSRHVPVCFLTCTSAFARRFTAHASEW